MRILIQVLWVVDQKKIEDITGSVSTHGPAVHGTFIINDEDEVLPTTNFTSLTDVTDYTNDIEEKMIQAAIEASKREAVEYGKQKHDVSDSLPGPKLDKDSFVLEDSDLAYAVSLSLKTAKRESVLCAQGLDIGEQSSNASDSRPENSGRPRVANGSWRQGLEKSKSHTSNQANMDDGDPPFEDEVDVGEEPLVRHRSIHAASGNAPQQIGVEERVLHVIPSNKTIDVVEVFLERQVDEADN